MANPINDLYQRFRAKSCQKDFERGREALRENDNGFIVNYNILTDFSDHLEEVKIDSDRVAEIMYGGNALAAVLGDIALNIDDHEISSHLEEEEISIIRDMVDSGENFINPNLDEFVNIEIEDFTFDDGIQASLIMEYKSPLGCGSINDDELGECDYYVKLRRQTYTYEDFNLMVVIEESNPEILSFKDKNHFSKLENRNLISRFDLDQPFERELYRVGQILHQNKVDAIDQTLPESCRRLDFIARDFMLHIQFDDDLLRDRNVANARREDVANRLELDFNTYQMKIRQGVNR